METIGWSSPPDGPARPGCMCRPCRRSCCARRCCPRCCPTPCWACRCCWCSWPASGSFRAGSSPRPCGCWATCGPAPPTRRPPCRNWANAGPVGWTPSPTPSRPSACCSSANAPPKLSSPPWSTMRRWPSSPATARVASSTSTLRPRPCLACRVPRPWARSWVRWSCPRPRAPCTTAARGGCPAACTPRATAAGASSPCRC